MDQHIAPIDPRVFAATGISILESRFEACTVNLNVNRHGDISLS